MGRQNKDQEVVGSSILLLQQRFEQLERLKKMREERQLRRTLAQSRDDGRMSGFASSEAALHQDRLALGLHSNANHVSVACSRAIEHQHEFPSDDIVDTSLRL
ncbi:uncharacterized protein LOC105167568 [Sesamum indicum]|uniref:Uncharacterized protein LOC105167568 n=1 Tax=Sesamum indicum TaxID=4182 RepID=A0A6I9TMG9_SESIN|nr:uncharacterized protein LOC105167568 [Sesamum indicum]